MSKCFPFLKIRNKTLLKVEGVMCKWVLCFFASQNKKKCYQFFSITDWIYFYYQNVSSLGITQEWINEWIIISKEGGKPKLLVLHWYAGHVGSIRDTYAGTLHLSWQTVSRVTYNHKTEQYMYHTTEQLRLSFGHWISSL